MMNLLLLLLIGAIWMVALWPGVRWLGALLRERRRVGEELLVRRSARGVVMHLLTECEGLPRLPLMRLVGRRRLLAELLARLSSLAYGLDPRLFRQLVLHHRLDRYLLRRARFTHGLQRALCLRRLAELPALDSVRRAARRYLTDRSREVAFAALLVQVGGAPHDLLRLVACYPYLLTVGEAGELLHHLRRAMLPVAYHPLLAASNPNLQRLGLAVVAQFAIEEADVALYELLARSEDRPLSVAAMRTLASLHRPLQRRDVALFVRGLSPALRRSLMRRLAREGYAPRQVRSLFDADQRLLYGRLVESYKRSLVCG